MSNMSTDADNFASSFFEHVERSVPQYISELGEAVAFQSVSAVLPQHLPDIIKMMEWTASYIERLGGEVQMLPNPKRKDDNGNDLPPILLAEFKAAEDAEEKKTVCCYAHLDVQPAAKEDGWDR